MENNTNPVNLVRIYVAERSTPRSSVIHHRTIRLTTPDESGNYSKGSIKKHVGNNDPPVYDRESESCSLRPTGGSIR